MGILRAFPILACGLFVAAGPVRLAAQTQLTWVTNPQLPGAVRGVPYSITLTVTGGNPPRTFSLVNGTLPPGLQVIATGAITGTPTQAGSFAFIIRALDTCSGAGCTQRVADRGFSLTVTASGTAALAMGPDTLAAGSGCATYSQTMTASGGTPPYSWSATGLPSGLAINAATGAIAGTATAGSYNVSITVRDGAAQTLTRGYTLTITGGTGLQISTTSLPAGTVGTSYTASIAASGGAAPYVFTATEQPVPGLVLSPAGALSGTPAQAGSYSTLYTVADSAGCTASRRITTQINPQQQATALSITTPGFPSGRIDASYTQALAATGGTPPYVWSVAGGELPAGLELNTEGAISGTPAAKGAFAFLLRVTDGAQRSVTRQFSIVINGAMVIETATLPAARVAAPYNFVLVATGGLGGLTWSLTSGSLPSGMQLGLFNGQISGTPFAAGEFTFEVMVKDSENYTTTKSLTLTVGDILAITTDRLPAGKIGQEYSASIATMGGVAPLAFEATGLPPGLTMDSAGAITGTPATSGAWVVTVRVTDSTKGTVTKSVVISVETVFRILTETLASGSAGTPYNELLTAVDGKPPYRWSVAPRALPIGVNLGEGTGQLTGTPVEPGEYAVQFRVTDSTNATAEKTLTISIKNGFRIITDTLPAANINVLYNAGLQTAGARTPITWSISAGVMPTGFLLDPATGIISGRPAATGEYAFTIKAVDATFTETTKEFKLLVRDVLRLSPASLSMAEAGQAYEQKIAALDAQGTLTWSLLSGALPEGVRLEFTADGAMLTGTPGKAGTYQFSVQARDAAGQSVTQVFTMRVLAALSVVTDSLRDGFVGVAYSVPLAADGGEPGYSWSVASGLLPGGIQLDSARGLLTGNPSEPGAFAFSLRVSDSKGRTAARAFSLRVIRDLTPVTESLSAATVGMRYAQQLRALLADVTWSVTQGRLPDGLALNSSTGDLRGVPSREGSYTFTIEARDAGGASGSRSYTIPVARLELPRLSIEPPPAVPARQGPVVLTLAGPAPTDLTGTLTVRFQSDVGADDPSVRLSAGRSASFTIAQGSTRPTFPGGALAALLQTGTTAGTILLDVTLASNGVAVTPDPAPSRSIRIPRAAPVLTAVSPRRVGAALNIDLTGFATNREVTSAEFQFAQGQSFTVSLQAPLAEWYRANQSQSFGSLFQLTVPFLTNTSPTVTVTLVNSVGRSQPVTARIQ